MRRNECGVQLGLDRQLDRAEVEEEGQVSPAGQAGAGLAQLVEEGVGTGLQRGQPGHRRVLQQAGAQGDGLRGRARLKHLCPGVCFDLWKFELCVVGVHLSDLLSCGSTQNLNDLH